ncbi:MAG TPA: tetratricopeptide repeat protein [Burkholderiales bacterium]|nr:tetratricopeptide repeat protein [Burkholderiales bacterium]
MKSSLLRAAALPLALLAGCVAPPPANPPATGEAAVIEANRRADAYLRNGDLEGAARQYREAVRLARSVEDAESIAVNVINLSIVYQRLGRADEARASLALLLERGQLPYSSERMAQAALRRSVLDLEERRTASAGEWVERAAAYCGQRGCAVSAAIQNVRGQLALESGRPDQAAASAKAALSASRTLGDRAESANALRLLGTISIRAGDAGPAAAYLGEALAIDRELASPRKIYLDLIALGRASALRGDRGAARSFYERARAVSEADRDADGATQARALIDALGDNVQARQPAPGRP